MITVPGIRNLNPPLPHSVVTIGNFDSVHLGHRALIQNMLERAQALMLPSVVLTFDPHPVQVLYPERKLKRIFDLADQKQELQKLGVDYLILEPFSREFSQLSPEDFFKNRLLESLHPETLVVGHDFSFGAHRQGSIDFLKKRTHEEGVYLISLPPVLLDDVPVSSSRIRHSLSIGDIELVNRLLDREFYIRGLVEKGAGRGRQIGVPTANLHTDAESIPKRGVYAGWAVWENQKWPAVINVGKNPTFGELENLSIEAHLLDFQGDLYGFELKVLFNRRLRDEMKFESAAQLVQQIHQDIAQTRSGLT